MRSSRVRVFRVTPAGSVGEGGTIVDTIISPIEIARAGNRPARVIVRNASIGIATFVIGLDPQELINAVNPLNPITGYLFFLTSIFPFPPVTRTFVINKHETLYAMAAGTAGATPVLEIGVSDAFSLDLEP